MVLHDPLALIEFDSPHSALERRFRVTGTDLWGRTLVVVIAVRPSGTIRLLSARRPTRHERHAYEGLP